MNKKNDCQYCKLVRKEDPVSVIYEDDKTMAFLTVKPINEGHTLVITKKHYDMIYNLPEDEISSLFQIVKLIAFAVKKSVNAKGISIRQYNGVSTGQKINHVHVHIIPRYNKDEPTYSKKLLEVERTELNDTANKIRMNVLN
jgi:histidine triad (HIT) family protein